MQQRATASWWRPLLLFASVAAAIAVATDTVPGGLLDGVSQPLIWAVIILIPALVLAIPADGSDLDQWRRAQRDSPRASHTAASRHSRRPGSRARPRLTPPMAPERTAELRRLRGSLSAIERQRSLPRKQAGVRPGVEHLESLLAMEIARLRSRLRAVEQQVSEAMGEAVPGGDADQRP